MSEMWKFLSKKALWCHAFRENGLCHSSPQKYGVNEAVQCFCSKIRTTRVQKAYFVSLCKLSEAMWSKVLKGRLASRFARKENGSVDAIKGFNFNKCFWSVVGAKTKSAAEVAFEKALPWKSSFVLPCQRSKPRRSSLWSWLSWEAAEKSVWKGLWDREKCDQWRAARRPISSVERPLRCLSSNRLLREGPPKSGSPKFKLFKGCLSFRFFSFPLKRGTAHKQTFSAENQ